MIEGYRPKGDLPNLTFGIHYHKGLETHSRLMAEGESYDDAMLATVRRIMIDSAGWVSDHHIKTRETLIRSIVWYLEEYRGHDAKTHILANGKAAVELSFKMDLGVQVAGQFLTDYEAPPPTYLLSGHIDRIVDFAGDLYASDHKTTSTTPGPYFFRQFEPHNQMSLYTIAANVVFGAPVKGVIIDAAQVAVGFTRFQRGMTHRTPDQLEEWLIDAKHWLRQAEGYAEEGYWPQNDTSCLTGSTEVSITRGTRAGWKISIEHLSRLSKTQKFDKSLDTYLLADVNGIAKNQKLLEVIKTGEKPVFLIKTGRTEIKATADHQFKLPGGTWKRVDQLLPGDLLLYWDNGKQHNVISYKYRKNIGGLYYYPRGWNPHTYIKLGLRNRKRGNVQRLSVLTVEARMNCMSVEEFIKILKTDEARAKQLKYLSDDLEVHHKDKDETNDDPNNLEALTVEEHKKEHPFGEHSKKFVTTRIISITPAGIEETYDLAMEGPHHNFIANKLVAHNCTKYGACAFQSVCSRSPSVRQKFLDSDFMKRPWNPLESR